MPDTPPRYRYQRESSDSEDSDSEDAAGVLAAARHNMTEHQALTCPGAWTGSGVDVLNLLQKLIGVGGLQAPQLLQLGQLAPPILPDMLNRTCGPCNVNMATASAVPGMPGIPALPASMPSDACRSLSLAGMPGMHSMPSVPGLPGSSGLFNPLANSGGPGFSSLQGSPSPPFPASKMPGVLQQMPGQNQVPPAHAGVQQTEAIRRTFSAGHGHLRDLPCNQTGVLTTMTPMPPTIIMNSMPQQPQQQQQQQQHSQRRAPTPGPALPTNSGQPRHGGQGVNQRVSQLSGANAAPRAATTQPMSQGRRSDTHSLQACRSHSPASGQQQSMRRPCTPVRVQHLSPPQVPPSPTKASCSTDGLHPAEQQLWLADSACSSGPLATRPISSSAANAALCPSWGTSVENSTRVHPAAGSATMDVPVLLAPLSFGSVDMYDSESQGTLRFSPLSRRTETGVPGSVTPVPSRAVGAQAHTPPATPAASSRHTLLSKASPDEIRCTSDALGPNGHEPVGTPAAAQVAHDSESKVVPPPLAPPEQSTSTCTPPLSEISGGSAPSSSMAPPRRGHLPDASSPEKCRVLVTGATGLLGRQLLRALDQGAWVVRGVSRTRGRPPRIIACDLTANGAPEALIEDFRPHVVIHLAAAWRPDILRRSPARARQLNVDVTAAIAASCERSGAWLIFVSADCVFDGRAPPYTTDAAPNPLSEYGWQKLHGEQLALAACPQAAVLRVPLLYGPLESIRDSAVTSLYQDLRGGVKEVDAWQVCYPTWAGDVAGVILAMLRLHQRGEHLRGIFHWQGSEPFTWHEMMMVVAEISGMDASNVAAVRSTPKMPLPRDTRLDCSRLESLVDTAALRTNFKEGLRSCLVPFCKSTSSFAISVESGTFLPTKGAGTDDALCEPSQDEPERQFRDELNARGVALQELFWQELERTRSRLREAGLGGCGRPQKEFAPSSLAKDKMLMAGILRDHMTQSDDPAGRSTHCGVTWANFEASGLRTPKNPLKHKVPGTLYFPPEQQV
eukprot:CAMPEP_0179165860 /NCGR_PEP_ID=MMETSP0796-20121207/81471_1 /TAXON_ID=73915 /ORGANISM="Pyrodinium bahamense, Strain pbaha01" /LENGTH=1014 /DNA_ID=CAMNT_0020868431 /DNA_START=44 /DNA_END=3089 /DNA_ORIENTATION=-